MTTTLTPTPVNPHGRKHPIEVDGIPPEGVWDLADVASRCPVPELRADRRRDVFWSGDWIDRGNPVAWKTRTELEREARYFDGPAEWPAGRPLERDWAESFVADASALRTERMLTLGALDQWRTATLEQVASIAGMSTRTAASRRVLSALLGAGLVDYGVPVAELSRSRKLAASHLPVLRPNGTSRFDRLVGQNSTYAELVAVTGGLPYSGNRQFDRHNMISTELGLRSAEYCDGVGAVVGEKLARTDALLPRVASSNVPGGDLVLVREDGLRIVVETTAQVSTGFREKVARWARLLDMYSLESTGVVVVFVEAQKPATVGRRGSVLAQVRKQVSLQAASHPGPRGKSVADRMFVASWSDWFPGPHLADESFFDLEAVSPTGLSTGGGQDSERWQTRSLLDPGDVPFAPSDPEAMRAVLTTSRMLAGSPFWLRDGADVGVWNAMLEDVGIGRIPQRVPKTSVKRPDGTWGPPEQIPPVPADAAPRLPSRGLPPHTESKLLRDAGVSSRYIAATPAWDGCTFDKGLQGFQAPAAPNPFRVG